MLDQIFVQILDKLNCVLRRYSQFNRCSGIGILIINQVETYTEGLLQIH